MKVLVTGGNGFVGSHLVEALLASGHSVRCLLRVSSDTSYIDALPVERVFGSLDDPKSLEVACAGVEAVCHFAGTTRAAGRATYFRVNEGGTRALLEACCRANDGISRFLYCSSLAAAGPADTPNAIAESAVPRPVSLYGQSKLAGESVVRSFGDRVPTVVLRPAPVYGPRDRDVLVYFRLLARRVKALPGVETQLVSVVHVADLVDCCLRALVDERAVSQTYFVSDGEPRRLEDVLDCIADVLDVEAWRVVVPIPLLSAAAGLFEFWARIAARPALLTHQKLVELRQRYWICDCEKACRELGYRPAVALPDGLASTCAWYREHGWL